VHWYIYGIEHIHRKENSDCMSQVSSSLLPSSIHSNLCPFPTLAHLPLGHHACTPSPRSASTAPPGGAQHVTGVAFRVRVSDFGFRQKIPTVAAKETWETT